MSSITGPSGGTNPPDATVTTDVFEFGGSGGLRHWRHISMSLEESLNIDPIEPEKMEQLV